MERTRKFLTGGLFIILSSAIILHSFDVTAQTTTKSKTQTTTKSTQPKKKAVSASSKTSQSKKGSAKTTTKTVKSKAEPPKDLESIAIGSQRWEMVNLNVSTFRNGDSIPQVKSNKDWVAAGDAGKPAWCYYNNNPAIGQKYGKLYNWYAVNDPRGLAPEGWVLTTDEDWSRLVFNAGGQKAGTSLKSSTGWSAGYGGTNESGFNGFPGGYRHENGAFMNLGSIGIWWTSTESRAQSAYDRYLSTGGSLSQSNNPKGRGESVRCIRPK
jgi:uncharacterized protein (TIGR02145 family)